jgi:hypothetical protein
MVMNDAASIPAMETMAARLASATGNTLDAARLQLRMAFALLAVASGADPALVNEKTQGYGFRIGKP